ncbi:MAG: DMT family transporter [Acholeplasmataceae bacterium]|nr:MAG: DMT family transporter [Acholeplasmataceae bacterium]
MQKQAHLAGVLFSTIFGFSFMFSKIALDHVSPLGLIAYRFLAAWVVFELLRLTGIIRIRFKKDHLKPVLTVVLLQPILYFVLEANGLQRTTSSEAGMMIALIPIFATLMSAVMLKEKPRLLQILFIILSVAGVMFIQLSKLGDGPRLEFIGFFLLLGAVLSAAFYNIASRSASRRLKPEELTYYMMLSGALAFNVFYVIELLIQGDIAAYMTTLGKVELVLPILYLGVVASIGGFFLVNLALSRLPAHVTSIYANLATIVAIIAGALLLDEMIYGYHIIGSAMIIIGVYGTVRFNRIQTKRHPG